MSILLMLILFQLSIQTETYEKIENFVQYSVEFLLENYKIFKYIPSCEDQNSGLTSIYFQNIFSTFAYLYIYDDESKIEYKDGDFLNPVDEHFLTGNINILVIENLSCNKEYFFALTQYGNALDICLFSILPEKIDTINISSLSKTLTFFKRTTEGENFFYSSEETKYIYITLFDSSYLKITEKSEGNEKIIYNNENFNITSNLFVFEKDKKYYIYFNSSYNKYNEVKPIIIQIFNESQNFKHNFANGPLFFTGVNLEYNYEIDISNYNIGDNLIFTFFGYYDTLIRYRYKNSLSDYLISMGNFESRNFIPIKLTQKDSSIILNIKISTLKYYNYLFALDLLHIKFEEIISNDDKIVNGPILLKIDWNKFNNFNSIGIQSNESFFLQEQEGEVLMEYIDMDFVILTQDYFKTYYKQLFIVFSEDKYSLLQIKKYDYPIYSISNEDQIYIPLCHKNDHKNELYLYSAHSVYTSFYGNFTVNFTYNYNIKTLSDLNYSNTIENNFAVVSVSYLKITCDSPVMLSNLNYKESTKKQQNLKSGGKIYLCYRDIVYYTYTLDETLVGEIVPLKFKLYGIDDNYSIKLFFNKNEYNLNSTIPLEFNYHYQDYSEDLIYFRVDDAIKNFILIELIVGFLPKELESYKQIDFNNNLGKISLERNNGIFIRMPKEFDENLLDYFISFTERTRVDLEISYDSIEYVVPRKYFETNIIYHSIVPLFQINPYSMINEYTSNSNDVYFYIFIYNRYLDDAITFQIKKPEIVSKIDFNKLYALPALKDNYYYQINIPKSDYNSLIFQIINCNNTLKEIQISISNNYMQYQKVFSNSYYYSFPINNLNPIINIYDTKNNNYINIVKKNEIIKKEEKKYELNATIEQITNKTILNIKMNSLSYYYAALKNIYKYYLIINLEEEDLISNICAVISENKKLDKLKKQIMIIIEEDDSESDVFEKEVEINITLKNGSNSMVIIPALKDNNLLEFSSMESYEFNYTYYIPDENGEKDDDKDYTTIILICSICGGILLIIIIIVIIFLKKRKNVSSNDVEKTVLNQELNRLQEE